jgi:hypothetical protein
MKRPIVSYIIPQHDLRIIFCSKSTIILSSRLFEHFDNALLAILMSRFQVKTQLLIIPYLQILLYKQETTY